MENKKILLVEDDEFLLDLYSTKFSLEGFTVFQAKDGQEGVDLFNKEKPDVILLDIKMPKMDGWAALKEIRVVDKKVPVVVFTNQGGEDDIKKNQENQIDDYLVKSFFTPEEVVAKIRKLLNK